MTSCMTSRNGMRLRLGPLTAAATMAAIADRRRRLTAATTTAMVVAMAAMARRRMRMARRIWLLSKIQIRFGCWIMRMATSLEFKENGAVLLRLRFG